MGNEFAMIEDGVGGVGGSVGGSEDRKKGGRSGTKRYPVGVWGISVVPSDLAIHLRSSLAVGRGFCSISSSGVMRSGSRSREKFAVISLSMDPSRFCDLVSEIGSGDATSADG